MESYPTSGTEETIRKQSLVHPKGDARVLGKKIIARVKACFINRFSLGLLEQIRYSPKEDFKKALMAGLEKVPVQESREKEKGS